MVGVADRQQDVCQKGWLQRHDGRGQGSDALAQISKAPTGDACCQPVDIAWGGAKKYIFAVSIYRLSRLLVDCVEHKRVTSVAPAGNRHARSILVDAHTREDDSLQNEQHAKCSQARPSCEGRQGMQMEMDVFPTATLLDEHGTSEAAISRLG